MKRFASLMSMLLIVLLLAACSAAVGTTAQLDTLPKHDVELIGAVSYGP